MSEKLTEKHRRIVTLCIENKGDTPQDFKLFGSDVNRGRVNVGNSPDIKITSPNPSTSYDSLLVVAETNRVGLYVTNIYCDKKLKFNFLSEKFGWESKKVKYESIGTIVSCPIIKRKERKKTIYVSGNVSIVPDGWKLQPSELLMIDIELEYSGEVEEVVTKPTAFIKLVIENTSNRPQKYVLFNPNLNNHEGFGNSPDIKITWESKVEHYTRKFDGDKFMPFYGSVMKPEERLQNYRDLLSYIQERYYFNRGGGISSHSNTGNLLRVVNVYAPKRRYFLFSTIYPDGTVENLTKLALPYPHFYSDGVAVIGGSTAIKPCHDTDSGECKFIIGQLMAINEGMLEPFEKTFIELEVEGD